MQFETIQNFINGSPQSASGEEHPVFSPIDGSVLGKYKESLSGDIEHAVAVAKNAQKAWAALPIKMRTQVHYEYRNLLIKNRDELAHICHLENGKNHARSICRSR